MRAAKARQGAHYSRLVHEMPARAHNGTVQVSITLSMTCSHAKSIHGYGIIMTTAASFPRSPALHGVDVCTESVQSAGGEHYTRLHHTPSRRIGLQYSCKTVTRGNNNEVVEGESKTF